MTAARKRARAVRGTPEILASEIPSTPRPRAIVTMEERDGRIRALSARSSLPLRLGAMPSTCRIVALGGLGEVGKNMTVYEYDDSIVVVHAGRAFPRDEHLGVGVVLPDFSYRRETA